MPDRARRISLFLLGGVVLFACAGLALDANWPKLLRVASAFTTYATLLLVLRSPPGWSFPLAGALAGTVSGLVRPETSAALVIASALGGAAFGGVHMLLARRFRATRLPREMGHR